ncbi:MAG TPA: HAMP domain-containing sensor histidine kinase [Opitutaceae bacterium]|nr:HAMP domain-containing sensor histidine kinase [Opitutaceae bacterium]
MTGSSRRIYLYWLLLLLPTLAVGAGAIQLLRREQARLAEQATVVDTARLAAVEARARLVAENVELLVGDVETGLLDALADVPAARLDSFLDQWERTNPLVRTAFRCTSDGRLIRPPDAAEGENARGFVRRFAPLLRSHPPWSARGAAEAKKLEVASGALTDADEEARRQVTSNVNQVNSARRDVQALTKMAASSAPRAEAAGAREKDQLDQQAESPAPAARRGWAAWTVDGRLHLLGWVQPGGAGEVRGVDLELTALVARMGGTLPAAVAASEGYVLRDDKGRVLHQAGLVPPNAPPAARVPLAADLLPGWEVAAFVEGPTAYGSRSVGGGFFLVGSLLVGIFVVAILSGGSLLLRQAQRSSEEARQKTSFVANVSHEFKTPLTTIRLYSELLELGRVADEAKRGEYLRTIGRETQRLARLVNNVLDFSRLEQGRKKYKREPLDLRTELARLLDTHQPRLAEAGLTLLRELPAAPLTVVADRDALEQIVLNLLDNACKYAAGGGEVAVALAPRPGGGAELRVLDRGPGVPHAHRERVFEKFHRVDDTLTAEKLGAGLGLSIARQLSRGMGGDLRYEPRPGGGAAFVLELP